MSLERDSSSQLRSQIESLTSRLTASELSYHTLDTRYTSDRSKWSTTLESERETTRDRVTTLERTIMEHQHINEKLKVEMELLKQSRRNMTYNTTHDTLHHSRMTSEII